MTIFLVGEVPYMGHGAIYSHRPVGDLGIHPTACHKSCCRWMVTYYELLSSGRSRVHRPVGNLKNRLALCNTLFLFTSYMNQITDVVDPGGMHQRKVTVSTLPYPTAP